MGEWTQKVPEVSDVKSDNNKIRSTGMTSVVLGIISIVTCFVFPLSILAIVFGFINNDDKQHGKAIAGIILGFISIAIILGILYLMAGLSV